MSHNAQHSKLIWTSTKGFWNKINFHNFPAKKKQVDRKHISPRKGFGVRLIITTFPPKKNRWIAKIYHLCKCVSKCIVKMLVQSCLLQLSTNKLSSIMTNLECSAFVFADSYLKPKSHPVGETPGISLKNEVSTC
jgi:hypothetical protein